MSGTVNRQPPTANRQPTTADRRPSTVNRLSHLRAARGLHGAVSFGDGGEDSVAVALEDARPVSSALFEAIPFRQTTRCEFDGSSIASEQLKQLQAAGTGSGVNVRLLTERSDLEKILELVVQGNTAQIRDRAFVRELREWVRFNPRHAAQTRDGLFSGASGNPSVPTWLGRLIFTMILKEGAENDKYAKQIRSSAGIAVFVSDRDDKSHWFEAGRAFERFALTAASLGIRLAHVNQPVEVQPIRAQLADFLGVGGKRPDLVIRFGRGPEMPRSFQARA